MKILIPNPFTEQHRVRELRKISRQYRNRVVPASLQHFFDEKGSEAFNVVLLANGIKGERENIQRWKTRIVPIIMDHKYHFDIERPYRLARRYNVPFKHDQLRTTHSPSYPSGHTAQAHFIALKLSQKYPHLKKQFHNLAQLISQSRVDRGVHFPSDLKGGRLLARAILRTGVIR